MNTSKVILIVRTIVLLSYVGLAYTETSALSDPLQQYAQQCDQAIGITVPDFNCDPNDIFTGAEDESDANEFALSRWKM